jgi:NAD(P)H-hydrate epimerase
VIPVVTPAEMALVDAAAPESLEELVGRAGVAVARVAHAMCDGSYGRRVVVVAGKGNNGADGRAAARWLSRRGVGVEVLDAADLPARLPPADLVIDAAYGTGFRGRFDFPEVGDTPVLAVDIPSGVDGTTGRVAGRVARATRTVTFAALKPGLLLHEGRELAGRVEVADIGLDVSRSTSGLVTDEDAAWWLPRRATDAHKWRHAVWVVGGSPGMTGAPRLAARAALRAGAGYVRLSIPGAGGELGDPIEAVSHPLDRTRWHEGVAADVLRFGAVVLGPGLGRSADAMDGAARVAAASPVPVVIDGDALRALGPEGAVALPRDRATVLTPHDGEYEAIAGDRPEDDRWSAAHTLAIRSGAVVLLKGPTTVVAAPDGRAAFVTSGDARLATAGSGDVLSGMVGAFLAGGLDAFRAAALAAHLHGRAAALGPSVGLVAGDLPDALPQAIAALPARPRP